MKMQPISVIALSVILLASCGNTTTPGGATADEICRQNGETLPTRSVDDTEQTQDEIQNAYAVYRLTCPEWAHLIP